MSGPARHPLSRYGVVPLAVAAATLLRWPLWPVLRGELAFLLLWPTVLFCAWWGGLGPGLLATLLSALSAAYFLLEPRHSLAVESPAELLGVGVFVSLGVLISVLQEKLHASRRLAERQAEEVARHREWLRVVLASIADGVIATDEAGRVVLLNPTAESLTGWTQDAGRGRPLEDVYRVLDEETDRPLVTPVAKVLRGGQTVALANHTVLVARDGTRRPVEDSAAPIRAAGGDVIGVILVAHDVAQRRGAERERLELLGRERAARAEAERLLAAAREADRRKDEFLAMLGHELRNPLAAIKGGVTLLRLKAVDEGTRESAITILAEQTDHVLRLVDDLLDVSRIVRGHIAIRRQAVVLQKVVGDAVEMVRPQFEARRCRAELTMPREPLHLDADPARLTQVFENLLANAAKFSPEGSLIDVTVESSGGEAVVRVRDYGIGMSPELLPHVFDLFTQAERSLDRPQGGLGIGLTVVRRLVELHGGRVDAASSGEGQGSEFTVRLPLSGTPS